MAFLVDAISGHYELGDVALRFLGVPIEDTRPSLFSASNDEALVRDVHQIARLRDVLRAEIDRWELNRIYEEVELPLVAVLGRMEARGIRVDASLLRTISEEFATEARELEAEIQKVAGHEFKVNSPQQLQVVLFDEAGPHRQLRRSSRGIRPTRRAWRRSRTSIGLSRSSFDIAKSKSSAPRTARH